MLDIHNESNRMKRIKAKPEHAMQRRTHTHTIQIEWREKVDPSHLLHLLAYAWENGRKLDLVHQTIGGIDNVPMTKHFLGFLSINKWFRSSCVHVARDELRNVMLQVLKANVFGRFVCFQRTSQYFVAWMIVRLCTLKCLSLNRNYRKLEINGERAKWRRKKTIIQKNPNHKIDDWIFC